MPNNLVMLDAMLEMDIAPGARTKITDWISKNTM